ncbi:MAG: helix-turn-helix transcriptional regulator [Firmicutes bacterium]|nr:helix-turn-helix transcriptional regulator [Bacillota bacterium]
MEDICREIIERQKKQTDQLTQRLLEYIRAHSLDYDISMERVADNFGLSINRLCNIVKEATNYAFREYVVINRMHKAKQLLEETDILINEISLMVGYSNVSHFIKTFKANYNITPSQYRTQMQVKLGRLGTHSTELPSNH